jgi:hypothetical protein
LIWMAVWLGCATRQPPPYGASLFSLASGFSAKEVCSCIFVSGRSEDECREWTRVSPNVARFKVDNKSKVVTANAVWMGRTQARYVDEKTGCVIVER